MPRNAVVTSDTGAGLVDPPPHFSDTEEGGSDDDVASRFSDIDDDDEAILAVQDVGAAPDIPDVTAVAAADTSVAPNTGVDVTVGTATMAPAMVGVTATTVSAADCRRWHGCSHGG